MNKNSTINLYLRSIEILWDKVDDKRIYPFSLPVMSKLKKLKFKSEVTFLIGENGSGKSTLIEAMAILLGFNAEGGSKNFNFSTEESHSKLHHYLRPVRGYKKPRDGYFLRAESFYNVATNIDVMDREHGGGPPIKSYYGGLSLHQQSHGEAFWSLLTKRFGGNGLYILDEPEAALSPTRQMAMLARMHELVKKDSQFIIATHSPILLAYPEATIYELRDGKLQITLYEDTEHYKITKQFLTHYKKQLDILLADDEP